MILLFDFFKSLLGSDAKRMQKNPFRGALEGSGLGQVTDFDDFKYPFRSSGHQILQDRKKLQKTKKFGLDEGLEECGLRFGLGANLWALEPKNWFSAFVIKRLGRALHTKLSGLIQGSLFGYKAQTLSKYVHLTPWMPLIMKNWAKSVLNSVYMGWVEVSQDRSFVCWGSKTLERRLHSWIWAGFLDHRGPSVAWQALSQADITRSFCRLGFHSCKSSTKENFVSNFTSTMWF